MRKMLIFIFAVALVGVAVSAACAAQLYQDQYGRILAYNEYGQLYVVKDAPQLIPQVVAPPVLPPTVPKAQVEKKINWGGILLGAAIIGGAIALEHNNDNGRRHHPPRYHGGYRDYGRHYRPHHRRYAW